MCVASVQYSLPGILMRLDVHMKRDDIGAKKNVINNLMGYWKIKGKSTECVLLKILTFKI